MEKLWDYDPTNVGWMLKGFGRYKSPLPMRRSMEMLPGVYTFDPTFLEFIRTLSTKLNEHRELQPNVDPKTLMVGENAVHEPFDRLRTVAGYASSPLSWVSVDNSLLCDNLGIPADFRNDRHRRIFDEFYDIIFSEWKQKAVRIPKRSTFGLPSMHVYDAEYKKDFALWVYQNLENVRSLFRKSDFESLAREYGIVFCYNLNRRGQVDKPGKVRESNTLEYALSGGRNGQRVHADKKVTINGITYDDFSAMRERVVQGAPWSINCILQVIYSGHMHSMFERFPAVFHITDENDVARDAMNEGDASFTDVTQYDETMRSFLIDRMFDRMNNVWPSDMVEISRALLGAGYYSRPLDISGKRGQFVGNPMRPTDNPIKAGNRSGWAGTSFIAKTMKVYETLTVIDDVTKDVVGNVRDYLQDSRPYKIRNNGDDEGILGSKTIMAPYRIHRFSGNAGYFKVEPEVGQVMSGRMIDWKNGTAYQRLHTTFEKFYVNERSIGGTFRKRWVIGLITRLNALDNHPKGHIAAEIHRQCFADILEPKFGPLSEMMLDAVSALDVDYDGLTPKEKELLDDPMKIHYAIFDDEVSDQVLEKIVTSIEPSEVQWAADMFAGNVH